MDIILYNIVVGFTALLLGYFFGSIPFGVILCKLIYKKDPRLEGSKNSGGTNVGRLFGKKLGLTVIILDGIKTAIPLIIAWAVITFSGLRGFFEQNLGQPMFTNGVLYIYLAALGAAIGHCYPIFAGFRGGKAMAAFAGFGLATSWFVFVIGLAAFFITLKIKKYVSLGSMVCATVCSLVAWSIFGLQFVIHESFWHFFMWGWGSYLLAGWEYASVMTVFAIILIARHHANIGRLIRHEEHKIKWMD